MKQGRLQILNKFPLNTEVPEKSTGGSWKSFQSNTSRCGTGDKKKQIKKKQRNKETNNNQNVAEVTKTKKQRNKQQ